MPVYYNKAPIAPLLNGPLNQASGVSSTPTFLWEEDVLYCNSILRIYDGGQLIFTSQAISNSAEFISYTLPTSLSGSGNYTWNVEALNAYGSATSETFSFSTSAAASVPDPVPSITITYPNANNIPQFDWPSVANVNYYHIKILDTQSNILYNQDVNGTTFTGQNGFNFNSDYSVIVTAINTIGSSTDKTVNFTTPAAPLPGFPIVTGDSSSNNIHFSWLPVDNALSYKVIITRQSDGKIIYLNLNQPDVFVDLRDQYYNDTFLASVTALGTYGSSDTATASANTGAFVANNDITNQYPANNATQISVNPIFTWDSLETNFEIQIATDSLFNNIIESATLSTKSYKLKATLDGITTYYWRVRVSKTYNEGTQTGYSPWTATAQFKTDALFPGIPSPQVTLTGGNTINITWAAIPYATSYHIKVVRGGITVLVDNNALVGLTYQLTDQYYGTDFTVFVSAINSKGESAFGTATITTDAPPAIAAPVITAPVDGSNGINPTSDFTWTSAESIFEVQLASDVDFTNIISSESNLAVKSWAPGNVLDWTSTYYFRVRAKHIYNDGNLIIYSPWGSSTFTIENLPVPPAIDHINVTYPEAANIPKFDWPAVQYADYYNIKISNADKTVDIDVDVYSTEYLCGQELAYYVTYTVVVVAINASGTSAEKSIMIMPVPTIIKPTIEITIDTKALTLKVEDTFTNNYLQKFNTDPSNVKGLLKVTGPDGTIYVNNGWDTEDFSNPDTEGATGTWSLSNLAVPSQNGRAKQGEYQVNYKIQVNNPAQANLVFTSLYVYNHIFTPPRPKIDANISYLDLSLTITDNTSYGIKIGNNYRGPLNATFPDRLITVRYPIISTLPNVTSNKETFSVPNLVMGNYDINYHNILEYSAPTNTKELTALVYSTIDQTLNNFQVAPDLLSPKVLPCVESIAKFRDSLIDINPQKVEVLNEVLDDFLLYYNTYLRNLKSGKDTTASSFKITELLTNAGCNGGANIDTTNNNNDTVIISTTPSQTVGNQIYPFYYLAKANGITKIVSAELAGASLTMLVLGIQILDPSLWKLDNNTDGGTTGTLTLLNNTSLNRGDPLFALLKK